MLTTGANTTNPEEAGTKLLVVKTPEPNIKLLDGN